MLSHARIYPWPSAAAKVLVAVAVLIAVTEPAFCNGGPATATAMNDTTPLSEPYRGFNVTNLDPATLNDAAKVWHANIVRYAIRIYFDSRVCHCSEAEAWDKVLRDLPAGLDAAKKLNMVVVLDMTQIPTVHHPQSREERSAFWDDDNNLKALTLAWTQLATICANRNQVIWFDLLNEPLNWNDMPGYPRKWPVWAQSLIDRIRQIDQYHQIVIEPGPGGKPSGFKTFPKLRGEGLIYSFHQYSPGNYTMQRINITRGTDQKNVFPQRELHWPFASFRLGGPSGDKEGLAEYMQPAVDFQKRYGVRMFVGEFSVARWAPDGAQWLSDNVEIFDQHHWDSTYQVFRENPIWSLEYSNDYQNPKNLQNTGQMTDRGQVMLKYLSHNLSGK